jgi:hypothetical protein
MGAWRDADSADGLRDLQEEGPGAQAPRARHGDPLEWGLELSLLQPQGPEDQATFQVGPKSGLEP